MYVKEVKLQNFRNYKKEEVVFHPNINIFTGNNAQGKTNLLESLYIMSLGKSFRTNRDSDMVGFDEGFCSAKIQFIKEDQERHIEMLISQEGKSIKIDGVKAQKTSDLLENFYTVVFSPEDLKIVKDEPEKRRKFMDRELCQLKPIYYKTLATYKKVLLQRNTLLKQEKSEDGLLDVWDESLVDSGSRIIEERYRFIHQLQKISRDLHAKITDGTEELELTYESDIPYHQDGKLLRETFKEVLLKDRKRDRFRGATGSGPHRDDIKLTVNGIDIRQFGSQGQQRTAALSMKLAEVGLIKQNVGEDAILLLDDVLSELDEKRQRFLIESLSNVQLFITTTDLDDSILKNIEDGQIYWIEQGKVEKKFDKKTWEMYNQ